jgi:hypothetical protein
LAGPMVGATACPNAGIAAAAASNTKGKYRRSKFMFSPPLRATASSQLHF